MALPTITLDDRSFDQLFTFMRKQINTGLWSDHNYSDPGIALLELLCWVGEMVLYRADRVPDAHVAKFADLILDPPEPVTVALTLTATLDAARTMPLTVPTGIRFATNFSPGTPGAPARRFIFETIEPAVFRAPTTLPQDLTQQQTVTARELMAVTNELLGSSTGQPDQTFPLRPVHSDLGLPSDALAPALLDFVHASAGYNPNPRVTVAGLVWELKQFLRTEQSYIDPASPVFRPHYMIDPQTNAIRFGNGTFGSIPPSGAAIVCTRYQLLQGADALIAADSLVHRLDTIAVMSNTETITPTNAAGQGAGYFFAASERLRQGLTRFRRPFRLITAADFQEVMLIDFNEFLGLARVSVRVLRAIALMNSRPEAPGEAVPAHVTLVVLAADPSVDLDDRLTDPAVSDLQKQALVDLTPDLIDRMARFLESRRLITTRIHVKSPTLVPVSINTRIVIASDRSTAQMTDSITQSLRQFLGLTRGGFDGAGWPAATNVYRSKLFRLLEGIDGVDHVETLTLTPANANGDVAIGALSLPMLSGLSVSVGRA